MFCRKCGAQNLDVAKFCAKCGAQLIAPQYQAQSGQAPAYRPADPNAQYGQNPNPNQQYQQPAPNYGYGNQPYQNYGASMYQNNSMPTSKLSIVGIIAAVCCFLLIPLWFMDFLTASAFGMSQSVSMQSYLSLNDVGALTAVFVVLTLIQTGIALIPAIKGKLNGLYVLTILHAIVTLGWYSVVVAMEIDEGYGMVSAAAGYALSLIVSIAVIVLCIVAMVRARGAKRP